MLPTGDHHPGDAFLAWQQYSQETPIFHVGGIVKGGLHVGPLARVIAAYDAPFPDERSRKARASSRCSCPPHPTTPPRTQPRRVGRVRREWEKPFLTAFSDSDAITRGGERVFQSIVPGAAGREHPTIAGAGHFLQEDAGPELARVVVDFIAST